MPRKQGSSHRWKQRQNRDSARIEAQRLGYRSRAAMKLIEINRRERLFGKGPIADLGSAPGSWSQVACNIMGHGQVIAVDLKKQEPIPGVKTLCGDVTSTETWQAIRTWLEQDGGCSGQHDKRLQGIMSDCAPSSSGSGNLDHLRSIRINEDILEFIPDILQPEGWFLSKILAGSDLDAFQSLVTERFRSWHWLKPPSSRPESRERYLLGRCPRTKITDHSVTD